MAAFPAMTRQWRDFDQSYQCTRIGRLVDITTRVVTNPGHAEGHFPFVCSGFETCRLFPRRHFPDVRVLLAPTGCPFMDSLRSPAP